MSEKNKLKWVFLRPSRYGHAECEAEFVRYFGNERNSRKYDLGEREYRLVVAAGGEVNLEAHGGFEVRIKPTNRKPTYRLGVAKAP